MGGFLVYGCLLVARVGLSAFLHTESSKFNGRYINYDLTDHGGWRHVQRMLLWGSEISLHFPGRFLLVFPSAWQLVSLFPDGCYHSPFYAVVIIESLWLVVGVFAFLWRLIAFMPVVVKPWVRMITFSWIVCQGVEKKNVTSFFFFKIYDEKTLATSLFAKIGTINCCNLFCQFRQECAVYSGWDPELKTELMDW